MVFNHAVSSEEPFVFFICLKGQAILEVEWEKCKEKTKQKTGRQKSVIQIMKEEGYKTIQIKHFYFWI